MDSSSASHISLSRIQYPVTTLGPGRRVGVWFQGCSIRCPGCISMDTWGESLPNDGVLPSAITECVAGFSPDGIDGITVSGGEPFDQPKGLVALLMELRADPRLDDADILVYSGYTLSYLLRRHLRILESVDALITGPYVRSRPTVLPWRGSANQRLSLLTERARIRYQPSDAEVPSLQVAVEDGNLWITGIPRREDIHRLEAALGTRGVQLGDVSWRS